MREDKIESDSTYWKAGECFNTRPIRFREVITINGYRLKLYEITYGHQELNWPTYQLALKQYSSELPAPPITESRPGVGFIICHQGRDWHYLVLCWWDSQNELIQKVFVRKFGQSEKWLPASSSQSVCVWDIEIIWFERNAYIANVLSNPSESDLEGYLSAFLSRP